MAEFTSAPGLAARLLQRLGLIKSVLVLSVVCVVFSAALCHGLYALVDPGMFEIPLVVWLPVLVPAVVAPPIVYFSLSILFRLWQAEEIYRNVFGGAQVGILWGRIKDGKVLGANDLAAEMFGYKNVEDLVANYDATKHWANPDDRTGFIEQGLRDGVVREIEVAGWRQDGSPAHVSVSARFYPERDYFESVIVDISDRKEAEAALRESADLLPETIVEIDNKGMLTYMNRVGYEITGYTAAEIAEGKVSASAILIPESAEKAREAFLALRSGKGTLPSEYVMLGKRGVHRPVMIHSAAIRRRGEVVGVRTLMVDISERKKAESELVAAKEVAEYADRAKSEFLANMSHELRTPLNAVIGFAEMMIGEIFGPHGSPKYNEYVTDIKLSADHLLKIIDDILDISKIETGHLDVEMQVLAVDEIIASCLSLIRHRARQSDVRLISEVQPGLTLFADPRLLQQILLNLLTNAVKFTPRGGSVTISAGQRPDGAPRIAVSDTGIGIAAADIDRVLEPFVRLESAFCANVEGTGLGLPLVKSLVELHGGSLEIESQPDTGTTVSVLFPDPGIIRDSGLDLCSSNGQREQRHGERAF
ncbi:MAG: PAS domain-containing sensor histidine kinase [Alphaproteobacteria bacterium]|nr:PAS domain-containing sensor histidine kinase [Alphaproteobacteria bacterium]